MLNFQYKAYYSTHHLLFILPDPSLDNEQRFDSVIYCSFLVQIMFLPSGPDHVLASTALSSAILLLTESFIFSPKTWFWEQPSIPGTSQDQAVSGLLGLRSSPAHTAHDVPTLLLSCIGPAAWLSLALGGKLTTLADSKMPSQLTTLVAISLLSIASNPKPYPLFLHSYLARRLISLSANNHQSQYWFGWAQPEAFIYSICSLCLIR